MELASFIEQCNLALKSDDFASRQALQYLLAERGLTEVSIADHKIGYCGMTSETLGEQAAVLNGRVIVPIFSEFGDPVAVAARVPNPKISGWWNTSFHKNNHLFLFNRSRKPIFDKNKVYVFEGYLDALMMYQHGLDNVVALMGVSLGYRRIGLLKRYCSHVCLVFDQDANNAGQRAQDRSVFELSRFHFDEISRIILPLGVDPDEFVNQHGLTTFLQLEQPMTKDDKAEAIRRYENGGGNTK
jgi:DNA primase